MAGFSDVPFDGAADFGFGVGNGVWSFAGAFPVSPVNAAGNWEFRFTDALNDSGSPDHRYLSGSFIELRGVSAIPLPAGLPLLLGALGMLGLARLRRSRG